MINTGAWETAPQPHLPKSKNDYDVLFRFGFQYQSFKFLCEYLCDKETKESVWFIYPYYYEFENNIIVFSDVISQSPLWQRDIYNVTFPNKKLQNLFGNFRENNIFYADDMTGTDFKQVIDFTIRR